MARGQPAEESLLSIKAKCSLLKVTSAKNAGRQITSSCKICVGSSTVILLFLRKKKRNLILKWKHLKHGTREPYVWSWWPARMWPLGSVTGGSAWLAQCLQGGAWHCCKGVRCSGGHLSFQNAVADEIRSRNSSNTKAIVTPEFVFL